MSRKNNRIFLFDVDGTLTLPRLIITEKMKNYIIELRKKVMIGIVGGSDLVKQKEQIGKNIINDWDYVFSENGLVAYKHGVLLAEQSFKKELGEERLKILTNFILHYIADLDIPIKRGTFVEFRSGMLNVSPIGRNCSQSEREEFEEYDHKYNVRRDMVIALQNNFTDYNLQYSIGGQISIDIFPKGWDKTYCIQYLERDDINEIYFFGDKTFKGGNDYEIYNDERVIGGSVTSPDDTIELCDKLLEKLGI
jgi:phosphomannomutase